MTTPRQIATMAIILFRCAAKGGRETKRMRMIVRVNGRRLLPRAIEQEHTDALGQSGWIPASYEDPAAIVEWALLAACSNPPDQDPNLAGIVTIDIGLVEAP